MLVLVLGLFLSVPFRSVPFRSSIAVVYAPCLGSSRFPYRVWSLSTVEGFALPPAFFVCPMDRLDSAETRGKKKKKRIAAGEKRPP